MVPLGGQMHAGDRTSTPEGHMTTKNAMQNSFFQPGSEKLTRALIEQFADLALDFLNPKNGRKLHSHLGLTDIESLFQELEIPKKGIGIEKTLQKAATRVVNHSVRVCDPHYIGHMTGASPTFHLGLELIIAAMNQNVVKIETALSGSFVEGQLLSWIHRLIFARNADFYRARIHKPDLCLGNVTSGGTVGNLTALAVARNKKIPRCKDYGLIEALERMGKRKVGIYASKRVHYSVRKAASVLGLGTQSVYEIPVTPFSNKIDTEALEKILTQHQAQDILPLALVGVAGSTETGSCDDLFTLAALAQKVALGSTSMPPGVGHCFCVAMGKASCAESNKLILWLLMVISFSLFPCRLAWFFSKTTHHSMCSVIMQNISFARAASTSAEQASKAAADLIHLNSGLHSGPLDRMVIQHTWSNL